MKRVVLMSLIAVAITCMAVAQDPTKPVLREGISVQTPVADHAIEMRDADALDATVVAVTAEGKLFVGTKPVVLSVLSNLPPGTVYVKADARVPYQKVLSVLDALRGRPVGLLTAPTVKPEKGMIAPPYGIRLTVSGAAGPAH